MLGLWLGCALKNKTDSYPTNCNLTAQSSCGDCDTTECRAAPEPGRGGAGQKGPTQQNRHYHLGITDCQIDNGGRLTGGRHCTALQSAAASLPSCYTHNIQLFLLTVSLSPLRPDCPPPASPQVRRHHTTAAGSTSASTLGGRHQSPVIWIKYAVSQFGSPATFHQINNTFN